MTVPTPGGFTPDTTLQQALDAVGGPMRLLWKPGSPNLEVPVVPPAFADWQVEQRAATESVALLDVSHHMNDLFIEGPDATRVLAASSANNYEKFAIGQAKQFIAVTDEGWLLQDAILARRGENKYVLTGIGTTHSWVIYHAVTSGADVEFAFDPSSDLRGPADPRIFRYQIQGPRALDMLSPIFGDQLDDIRFFHEKEVVLDGLRFSALRHGMAGEAGFEFIGPWAISEFVKEALLVAGEPFELQQVGGRVYYTLGVDSGWLATPVPGIYEGPADAGFRAFTKVFSYEGMTALQGSYFSPDIQDYYVNPYELGYGRSVSFNHEFTGREALEKKKDEVHRTKVTLVWNRDDVERVFGADRDIVRSYTKDRVLLSDATVGLSEYAASSAAENTIHSIAGVDLAHSAPGTHVELHWGQHPGPGDPGFSDFQTIRATVQPAPYHEYARSAYRGVK
jgi:glycine cleavage system aminomethyltransferase T